MERLAAFAATKFGKWLIGAAAPALGMFFMVLINSAGSLGLGTDGALLVGSILGSIAGRLGIPMPPQVDGDKS